MQITEASAHDLCPASTKLHWTAEFADADAGDRGITK